jgi:hypothetical protein
VVLLTSGGKTAFVGPPEQIETAMGTADWVDIFVKMNLDPGGAHAAFLTRKQVIHHAQSPMDLVSNVIPRRQTPSVARRPPRTRGSARPAGPLATPGSSVRTGLRQIFTVARRQARLMVADRSYFAFLVTLPFLLGGLSLVMPGHIGGGAADPNGASDKAVEILVMLNIAAVCMGSALSIHDLAGERSVFRREQSIGLSVPAYLAAKVIVFTVAASIQAGILTTIVAAGKGSPIHPAVLFGNPVVELYLTVSTTAVVSSIVGLCLSSLAKHPMRTLPMFVLTIMTSLVLCGGTLPLAGRAGHPSGQWILSMAMLMVCGGVCIGFLWWRLQLTQPGPPQRFRLRHAVNLIAA